MIEHIDIDSRILYTDLDEVLNTPRVIRVNNFDDSSVARFSDEVSYCHFAKQPVIPIVIDTDGGDLYSLLSMVDIIQSSKIPVATIIEGRAFSCGAVLFCCGTEGLRFMGKNSTLMIHDVLSCDGNLKKTEEVMVDSRETNRLNKKIYKIIDKGIGKPDGYTTELVQARNRTDWFLSPKKALELGYANHIRVPTLNVRVKVEISLDLGEGSDFPGYCPAVLR